MPVPIAARGAVLRPATTTHARGAQRRKASGVPPKGALTVYKIQATAPCRRRFARVPGRRPANRALAYDVLDERRPAWRRRPMSVLFTVAVR
ncbi:MAG: hypothetical protein AB1689_01625 [Thermodesulfobacteriota bacterium]